MIRKFRSIIPKNINNSSGSYISKKDEKKNIFNIYHILPDLEFKEYLVILFSLAFVSIIIYHDESH